jgi:hypothetical protein
LRLAPRIGASAENGGRSLLGVPLLFGEQVGGGFFFGTPREHVVAVAATLRIA